LILHVRNASIAAAVGCVLLPVTLLRPGAVHGGGFQGAPACGRPNCTNGAAPADSFLGDAEGNLYGTTQSRLKYNM
jgi:hypothetical protein